MDLRSKLLRLAGLPAPGRSVRPAVPLTSAPQERRDADQELAPIALDRSLPPASARAALQGEPVAAPSVDRAQILTELRRKMAEVMGRELAPVVRAEPSETLLPFLREERPEGVLYRRLERLPASHHVGRMPVDSAAGASPELLALLALDPSLSTCRFERALYLDTETTGLGTGSGILPFLVGLCWFDAEGRPHLEQLLLRRPGDERAMLARLRECVEAADVLVTYNGKTFDCPLLSARCVMNRVPPLPVRPHLDLLHVARRLHRARLGQCRLISLESGVLGFGRGPDVEGADVAARYAHFLRTGDEASLEAVVTHNAWDVVSMAALVGLYGEPIDLLHSQDLVGLARTLQRAGALERADAVVTTAVERGGGTSARRLRGDIAKARGDRARALVEFEALAPDLDDPKLRLELAKLYEHFVKAPLRALEIVALGTGETEEALARRSARLKRKAQTRPAR